MLALCEANGFLLDASGAKERLFLNNPNLTLGDMTSEKSPLSLRNFVSAVVFDIMEATEKSFYMRGGERSIFEPGCVGSSSMPELVPCMSAFATGLAAL